MMALEGHEQCIPIEKFRMLQELHDNQKKIIAQLQQKVQDLEEQIHEMQLEG